MPALQIRECPEDLYLCIKGSAEANHRSITREATSLLESCFGLDGGAAGKRKRAAALDALSQLGPLQIPSSFPAVSDLLHEESDRRADACLS